MSSPYESETLSSNEMQAVQKTEEKGRRGGMQAPFGVRDFRLLFGGQTISTIGDAFYAVALPWLVLTSGGSAQELGIILTAYGIPRVGSVLLGGAQSDRLRPRRVMLLADIVRAILVGILAGLALWGKPNVWQLCLVAVPLGAFQGLFLPASFAILPEVLHDEELQAGNALNFSSTQLAMLLGSALAGIVVASFHSGTALAFDAFTFVVSAVSLTLMRAGRQSVPEENAVGEGAENGQSEEQELTLRKFLRSSRLLQVAFLVSITANFCYGGLVEVALPALVHGPFGAGASDFGLILAAFGGGALAGGLVSGFLSKIPHRGIVALLFGIVQGMMIVGLPYGNVPGAALCMAIGGISNSITNIIFITIIQQVIPRHLLGRVMGLLMFASFGTYPVSVALAGVLTTHFGPIVLFPISGLALCGAILFGLTQPALRDL